ncbi:MAG: InlB B-repeat-containing protein, partial [Lachnospiraceae bacterium]|nr:InlB B-repeat-containing protein [Lachnospiraceae bacterium]
MNQRKKELIAKILLAAMIVPRTSQAALAAAQISEGTGRTAEILLETDSNAEAVWETDSKKILFTEKDEDEEPKKLPRYYQTADEDGIYFFEDRYGKMQYRIFGSIMGNGQKPESASDAYVEAGVPTGWYDRDTKKAVDLEEEYYMLAPYVWEAVPEEEVTGEHFKELFRKQPNLETTYETENYFYMGLYGENWDASRYGVWDFTDWDTAETEDDIQYWFYGHAVNTGQETADAWFAVSDGAAVYSSDVYTQAYAVGTDYGNDKTSGGSSGGVWVTNDRVYENIRASASADPEHNRIIVNVYKINKKASGSKEATYGVVGEVHLLLGGCHDVFLKKNKPRAGSYYPVSTNQQGRDVGDINRIGYSFSSTVGQKVKPKADYYRSTDNVKLNSEYVNLKKYAKDALDAPYIETQYYGLGTEDMNLDVKGGIFSVCIYNPPEDLTDIAFMMSQYNYYDHQEDGDSSHYESAFIHISDVNGVRLDSVMEELNKAKEVTLSFNGNGGTEKAVSIPAEPGKAIGTLPKASRTGYTFAGWYTAADGGSRITEQTAAPDTAMTYYAHWTVNRYTATFHSAGSHDGAVITKNYQDTLGTLPMTERTGYRFKGWFTAASGGNPVSPATKVGASDADYYAQWEANRWTVIYDANGGSGGMGVSTFSYGAENRLSGNTFTKTGYHFAGWAREPKGKTTFQDSAKAGNMTAVPEDTIYLYAVWEANPYSVTLHRNLGKEDTVSVTQQYQYDREYRLLERVFEKAGYTFAGWTAGRDGSGEFHEEGAKVHNWAEDGEIALYAQWTPNRYRLYYGANGGQVESPSKEVVYDAAVGELPVPKRTNYRFIGWTLHGKPAEAASLYRTEGDSYAYAQWELNFRLQEDTNTNIRPGKDDTFGTADDEIYTNGPDGIPNTEDDREVFPGKDGIYGTEDDYYILNPPHGDRIYAGADRKFNTPDDYMERGNGLILHPGGDCYFGEEPGAPLSAAEDNEIWWKGEDEKTGTKDTAADDRLVHAGKDEAYGTGDDYMDEETGKNRRPGRDGVFGTEDDSISFNGRDTLPGTADDYLHFAKPGLNHRPGADCVFDTEADELTDAGDDAWYWDGADGLPGTEDDTCVYPGEDGTYGTSDDFYQYTQTPYKGNRIYAGKDGIFGTSDDYMEYGQDGKLLYPGLDRLFGTGDDRVDTGKGTNTDLSGNAEQTNGADGIPGTADDKPIDTDTAGNRYVDNGDKTSLWPGLDGIFGTEDDRIDTGKGTNTDVSG